MAYKSNKFACVFLIFCASTLVYKYLCISNITLITNIKHEDVETIINTNDIFANYKNYGECKFGDDRKCKTIHIDVDNVDNVDINKNEKFTLVINTWKRNKCLANCLNHWLQCDPKHIEEIHIIWSDSLNNIIPPELLQLTQNASNKIAIIFDKFIENKLTNRFSYNTNWKTDAIFSIDDDEIFSCDLLIKTFNIWQLFPNYIIGFTPRTPYALHQNDKDYSASYPYFYRWTHSFKYCEYQLMFITKGGFLHKKYYKLYNEYNNFNIIKQFVDGNMTAEDITMSLLYTYTTKQPQINIIMRNDHQYKEYHELRHCEKSKTMHHNGGKNRAKIAKDTLMFFNDSNMNHLVRNTVFLNLYPSQINNISCKMI